MADCLRSARLYSEKRPRDLLFQAIEDILTEQQQSGRVRILSRLTREAALLSRQRARRAGLEFRGWDMASKAVAKAMLCAGVFIGPDDRPIPSGITAQASQVERVLAGYQDMTEAYLLEFLIRRLSDVTTRDHLALAHALFRQFDHGIPLEDLEDRVVILLARLAHRVELRDETYVVRTALHRR